MAGSALKGSTAVLLPFSWRSQAPALKEGSHPISAGSSPECHGADPSSLTGVSLCLHASPAKLWLSSLGVKGGGPELPRCEAVLGVSALVLLQFEPKKPP